MAAVYLVCDTRERQVIPFLTPEFLGYPCAVSQINTGDYLVCRARAGAPPRVEACLERKTLEDFAASLQDGRYGNLRKMLDMRARTGCQLYFLVEGPAFPAPARRFGHVPYASILAAMTKLMVRDGVHVIQTENVQHTAKRLGDLLRVFDTETPYCIGGGDADASAPESQIDEGDAAAPAELAIPAGLNAVIEQTDEETVAQMWAALRGVTLAFARGLMRTHSLHDFVSQKVTLADIDGLRTPTGRKIVKDAAVSLRALRAGSPMHLARVLSGIRNVTGETAGQIIEAAGGAAALAAKPVTELAKIKLQQKSRCVALGNVRASRIYDLLRYKDKATMTAAPRPASARPASARPAPPPVMVPPPVMAPPPTVVLTEAELDDLLGI